MRRLVESGQDVADGLARAGLKGQHPRPSMLMPEVGDEHAQRRQDTRVGWDDGPRDAQLGGQAVGVQRPGAAERDEREVARVVPALHGDEPDRLGHQRLGDADDALRRLAHRHVQALRPPAPRARAAASGSSRTMLSVKFSGTIRDEDDVGVGHGRLGAAATVARRARVGTGAPRSHARQAAGVDPGDAAAARADLHEVDDRARGSGSRSPSRRPCPSPGRRRPRTRTASGPRRRGSARPWPSCRPCRTRWRP